MRPCPRGVANGPATVPGGLAKPVSTGLGPPTIDPGIPAFPRELLLLVRETLSDLVTWAEETETTTQYFGVSSLVQDGGEVVSQQKLSLSHVLVSPSQLIRLLDS